jgi:hypothetical protein
VLHCNIKNNNESSNFLSVVLRMQLRDTSDPRDKIYGLLGAVKLEDQRGRSSSEFAVEYKKPVETVYKEFAV